ncbi:MAG: NUDIX hydrolase [Carbonactinosporaceae bacterium]
MRVPCVGAIARDGEGRLLVVRRTRPPGAGLWSLPGGRVERGETDAEALAREVREETGLDVAVGALVGTVDRPGPEGVVYEVRDYLAVAAGGALRAGDDASEARWVSPAELLVLPTTRGLVETLRGWAVLPRDP